MMDNSNWSMPTKWEIGFVVSPWWSFGIWVQVNMRTPYITFRLLWWSIVIGRTIDRKKLVMPPEPPPAPPMPKIDINIQVEQ